jgi:hypothetical protein
MADSKARAEGFDCIEPFTIPQLGIYVPVKLNGFQLPNNC